MPEDSYVAWMREHHAKFSTDAGLVDRVVAGAMDGQRVARRERILRGEVNEVYLLTLDSGDDVIVRISHGRPGMFAKGEEAIVLARAAGLPVPETIAIETVEVDVRGRTQQREFCLQRRLPGRPLEELVTQLSGSEVRSLILRAGELLGRLHGVVWPDSPPRPLWSLPSDETVREMCERTELLGGDPRDVERALEIAADVLESHEPGEARLVHGDYSTKHFMIHAGEVIGILDWDAARGDHPVVDLAWWDMYFDYEPHPTSILLEGYRRTAELPVDHELLRTARGLRHGCDLIRYYAEVENTGGAQYAMNQLKHFLHRWQALPLQR